MQGLGAGKAADLTYWESAARMIADVSKTNKIVSFHFAVARTSPQSCHGRIQ